MEQNVARGLTRRNFLKTTALAAGVAAGAGLAGCSTIEEKPEPAPEEVTKQVEEQVFTNICRGNCGGGTGCRMLTTVREGKVVRVTPEEFSGQKGIMQAGCVKGQTNPQRIYSPHRLLHPMKQTGERGSDNWERITWDEAYALMAEKIQAAFDENGPDSVGFYAYGGNSYEYLSKMSFGFVNNGATRPKTGLGFERFAQKTGVTLFGGGGDLPQLYVQLTYMQAASNSAEDFSNAKTLLLWGANPADAYKTAWPHVLAAKKNGTKLICIDPRYSASAAHSDMWVPIRPGSDGALILAMCNYIIENDLIDYDYLRNKSVAPLLIKEDGSYLRLSDLGKEPIDVPGADGKASQVDCEVVYDEATGTFGASREVVDPAILGTYEVNGMKVRTVYDWALETIAPYTVDFAEKECGIPVEQIIEITEAYAKDTPSTIAHWWGMEHFKNSWRLYFGIGMLASLTGNACKPGASYTPSYAFSSIYKTPQNSNWQSLQLENPKVSKMISVHRIPEIMKTGMWNGEEFDLRVLFVMCANPMESCIDYNAWAEAFSKIDFVVVHEQFMTDSVKWASLALPCSMSFESEDFIGVFMDQKAIEPVGEGKTNFEMLVGLSDALGYTDLYEKDAEGYLREILDTPENVEAGVAYEDYKKNGAIIGELSMVSAVGKETNPTGRTQFYLEYLPLRDYPDETLPIVDRLPNYEPAQESYIDNPLREKYPLFGLTYHDNYSGQSMFSHIPWINDLRGYEGEPFILISESAAKERGIVTGDMVKTFNDRGYVVTRAVVTKGLQADTIVAPRGYGEDEFIEGNVHTLTTIEAVDKVCSNDSHNDWLCQVEKM